MVTQEREIKLKKLSANRQESLTIILENVHDPHNLGAVLRTCDSVGIPEIYALYTIESRVTLDNIQGHRSSSGAKKWVDIHYFDDVKECFTAVRSKYDRIYGTYLTESTENLYDMDLKSPIALMFGNEHRGISPEALLHLDGNFLVPQVGMTQSLNISVACAVSLYEAMRQRLEAGMYSGEYDESISFQKELFDKYIEISRPTK